MTVAVSEVESSIGVLRLAATAEGLVRVAFPRDSGTGFSGWLARVLPGAERAERLPALEQAEGELAEYFAGQRREFKIPLDLRGTPFQLEVWRALEQIPFGETRSYADVARTVKRPRAFRAVGAANGANPVPLVIPCHRVIASGGKLGGYGGGLATKRKLLAFEQTVMHRDRLL